MLERLRRQCMASDASTAPSANGCQVLRALPDRLRQRPEYPDGIRTLVRMLEQKYHGVEWPHRSLPPESLADAVLARINPRC
jgi:hypothetical protein